MDKLSIGQIKAARALLDWGQAELAAASGVSEPTIQRLEAGSGRLGGRPATVAALVGALEAAGVAFIPENGGGPGVRLRAPAGTGESGS
ncbi:MAG: helix-turn-helix domain-containing protein, partial [Alphaproteobacteria bacterium]|nr:helix-turn-helix domain-containing protein [Alphaproteobacteria bacterium]